MNNLPDFANNEKLLQVIDMTEREKLTDALEKAISKEIVDRDNHDIAIGVLRDVCRNLAIPFWYHRAIPEILVPKYKLDDIWTMEVHGRIRWHGKDEFMLSIVFDHCDLTNKTAKPQYQIEFNSNSDNVLINVKARHKWVAVLKSLAEFHERISHSHKAEHSEEEEVF